MSKTAQELRLEALQQRADLMTVGLVRLFMVQGIPQPVATAALFKAGARMNALAATSDEEARRGFEQLVAAARQQHEHDVAWANTDEGAGYLESIRNPVPPQKSSTH